MWCVFREKHIGGMKKDEEVGSAVKLVAENDGGDAKSEKEV